MRVGLCFYNLGNDCVAKRHPTSGTVIYVNASSMPP